jgi:hypothetical protein
VRCCSASNSRVFSIAITAWSAKVSASSICFSFRSTRWEKVDRRLGNVFDAMRATLNLVLCPPLAVARIIPQKFGRARLRNKHYCPFGCARIAVSTIGTVSNVASRLCDEAKPGQILISPRVLTKVENAVKVEPVGEFALKGIRRPLAAYNVVAAQSSEA